MSPTPRTSATPQGIIADRLALMDVTCAMSSGESRFFAERAPQLASNRPRPTPAEQAAARGDFEEERALTAMVSAIRRRERERLQWLLEHDLVGGEALAWALQCG